MANEKWGDPREYHDQTWLIYGLYKTPNDSDCRFIGYSYHDRNDYYYGNVSDAIKKAQTIWPDADGWEITDRMAEHTVKHIFKEA